jgi:hypothetical protein
MAPSRHRTTPGTLTDSAGGSGLQFDSTTGTYTYVWKTSKSWAGTCQQFDWLAYTSS